MSLAVDSRGVALTGTRPGALRSYEQALAAFQGWRGGVGTHLDRALERAPDFVMARVMKAYLAVSSRDPRRVASARPMLVQAARLHANESERLHLAAIGAVLADDYEGARATLGRLLQRQPHDALALQMAHSFDYLTGDTTTLRERVSAVLPAWSRGMPGYHALLSMHAFGLGENGDYARAEATAHEALALNPADARAHHVVAHVFEMTDRPADGIRWLRAHQASWSGDTLVATHCWWHLALFHLAVDDLGGALRLYDEQVRQRPTAALADLIDASALLWRLRLQGADAGPRWAELALAWEAHIEDGFCSFSDVHAMLAFVGAGDHTRARRLERTLSARQSLPTRHGRSTRRLGLPACRALMAFGAGDHARAARLFGGLAPVAGGLGGSHAQRDALHLTFARAVSQLRRPALSRRST